MKYKKNLSDVLYSFGRYISKPIGIGVLALMAYSPLGAQTRETATETFDGGETTKSYWEQDPAKWFLRNDKLEAEDWLNTSGRSAFLFNDALYNYKSTNLCIEAIIDKSAWAWDTDQIGIVIGGDPIGNTYYEFEFNAIPDLPGQFWIRRQSPGLNETFLQMYEGDGNLPLGIINKGKSNKLKVCYDAQGYDFYINDTLVAGDIISIPGLEGYLGLLHIDSSNANDPPTFSIISYDNVTLESDVLRGGGAVNNTGPHIPDIFLRGDANMDHKNDVTDAVSALSYLFQGGSLECPDAADANDDGSLDISDPIKILLNRFVGGGAGKIPPPYIGGEGMDLTFDSLPKCNGYGYNPWEPH